MPKKRYNDGGVTGATQQPTYPFGTNVQPSAAPADTQAAGGVNQTFNMQPQATAQPAAPSTSGFKKGGKVSRSSASKRADGIAIRGRTRA
jgi:hypothetical protein